VEAITNLGVLYLNGKGVKKDEKHAVELFIKAAKKGGQIAQQNLSVAYFEGIGIKQNYSKALHWAELAIEQGPSEMAYLVLAKAYYEGLGVNKDLNKAISLFQKAAELGNPDAQFMVGLKYYSLEPKDFKIAHTWFTKSANSGHSEALYHLSIMYTQGLGVEQMAGVAYGLAIASREKGDERAQKIIDFIEDNVDEESVQKMQKNKIELANQAIEYIKQ